MSLGIIGSRRQGKDLQMSSNMVIELNNIAKCYQIYEKPHHRLLQMFTPKDGRKFYREFWAVKNISFQIPKGKIVGILGKNGAGKSTLLQMICGTLVPSSGSMRISGRVAALLELGSGFNPEFTGLENIYMNGQILGLSKEKIDEKLQGILDFADIGDFIHQPVKTYSSGMFARLAFSVVIHVEPEILIVDEALSVGDAWFQHKSMARMRQLMESGCTVLFVSHSIDAVRALCDEALWLEKGTVKMQGDVTDVTNAYMNDVFIEQNKIAQKNIDYKVEDDIVEEAIEASYELLNDESVLKILDKKIINSKNEIVDFLNQGEDFSFVFKVKFFKNLDNISLGVLIKDQFSQDLTGASFFNKNKYSVKFKKGEVGTFVFKSKMLLRGGQSYSLSLRINQVSKWDRSDNIIIHSDELAMVFDVISDNEDPMWFKFQMPFEVSCK